MTQQTHTHLFCHTCDWTPDSDIVLIDSAHTHTHLSCHTCDRTSDSDIVLIDFGFAEKCEGRSLTQQCGTPNYVAPEILAKKV